jgi:hypothetical protein
MPTFAWVHKQGDKAATFWLGQLGVMIQACNAPLSWACGPVHKSNLLSWTGLKVRLNRLTSHSLNTALKERGRVRLRYISDEGSSWILFLVVLDDEYFTSFKVSSDFSVRHYNRHINDVLSTIQNCPEAHTRGGSNWYISDGVAPGWTAWSVQKDPWKDRW